MNSVSKYLVLGLAGLLAASLIIAHGDSRDINDRLIATTVAIDRIDEEIWFYVEFANIQEQRRGGNGGGSDKSGKYILVKGHGNTIQEARQNVDLQLDMPIYLGGVRTLLISENFSGVDLVEYFNRLRADETYRKKVITAITRENLDELYKTVSDKDQSLGYSIENTIETLEASGEGFARTTSRILENLSGSYTGLLIPCIGLQGNMTALLGYSVVRDNKTVGFIPIEECRGLNLLKVDKARTSYVLAYNQHRFTVETNLKSRSVKVSCSNDQAICFTISLKFDAVLIYGDLKTPYGLTDEDRKRMTEMLREIIARDVVVAVGQAQTVYQTDYLQFDDAFRSVYPTIFKSLDWGEAFQKATVAADVKLELAISEMIDYGASRPD